MTKREKYGLDFSKWVNPVDKTVKKVCRREKLSTYSELQIIDRLSIFEIQSLLQSIQNADNGDYYEEIYSSERIDDESVEIHPPNIIINEICIIPLIDMRDLLQEWITFINT